MLLETNYLLQTWLLRYHWTVMIFVSLLALLAWSIARLFQKELKHFTGNSNTEKWLNFFVVFVQDTGSNCSSVCRQPSGPRNCEAVLGVHRDQFTAFLWHRPAEKEWRRKWDQGFLTHSNPVNGQTNIFITAFPLVALPGVCNEICWRSLQDFNKSKDQLRDYRRCHL